MIPEQMQADAIRTRDADQAKTIADAFRILDAIEAKARATTPDYDAAQATRDRVRNAVRIYASISKG